MLLHFPFLLVLQDFSQQPPAQELIARDLHDVEWKFRHIFRGKFELLSWGGGEEKRIYPLMVFHGPVIC
jgi:hypothetical protein